MENFSKSLVVALGGDTCILKTLGAVLGRSWGLLKRPEASWSALGAVLGPLGVVLATSGGLLELSWSRHEASWSALGAVLRLLGPLLEPSWGLLEPSWGSRPNNGQQKPIILDPKMGPKMDSKLGPAIL